MMTPAEVIADLDRAIERTGQDVIWRRYTASTGSPRPKIELPVRAFVRPLEAEDLVGNIDSTFSKVIMSATGKSSMLPIVKGDKIVIDGRERNVEIPKPYRYQNELIRIVAVVGG
jgi:hypothetical protein